MKDTDKYVINDDGLEEINGGYSGPPANYSKPLTDTYRINGYNYYDAAACINEFKKIDVNRAVGFANKQLFHDERWNRVRTEDALEVCRDLYTLHLNKKL